MNDDSKTEDELTPVQEGTERHELAAEMELRLEVPWDSKLCQITLQKGSCELWGVELALKKTYDLYGGFKVAFFTWHGCIVDVKSDKMEISYTSDETNSNVAYVNTHAQLEALRDEAAAAVGSSLMNPSVHTSSGGIQEAISSSSTSSSKDGPRVLIVGPPESGKSSLARVLVAYATKVGRCPLWIDLDPADNSIGVPGCMAVAPMDRSSLSIETMAATGIPASNPAPLLLWYGHTDPTINPDLYRAQVSALSEKIERRWQQPNQQEARSSGMIVNTHGNIRDPGGFPLLLHTVAALKISVVLIMGHDRLYSMMMNKVNKSETKVIKLPRSGGVVSREAAFQRHQKSFSIRRYFYGGMVQGPVIEGKPSNKIPELTPNAVMVKFSEVKIWKFTSVSLSNNLLPMGATQSTEAVQLKPVEVNEQLAHSMLAVVHPTALTNYEASGKASYLYESGVAGFVVVDKVVTDSELLHLLSPCAGSLPSYTFLAGDITFME